MRRQQWAIAAGLVVWFGAILVSMSPKTLSHAVTLPKSSTLESVGGIPVWPWMPGGILWHPRTFQALPYTVKQVKDHTLPDDVVLIEHPGREGTVLVTGVHKRTISEPQPATVAVGTAPVHALTVGGVTYHYDRVLMMMTTAYNGSLAMNGPAGPVAAWNGQPLHRGDVAVDPSVIPLGTYLYIDGYGPARAVDTGSAIWGDHIDLFFNESDFKIALYGIQFHKVYVLTGRPPDFSAS